MILVSPHRQQTRDQHQCVTKPKTSVIVTSLWKTASYLTFFFFFCQSQHCNSTHFSGPQHVILATHEGCHAFCKFHNCAKLRCFVWMHIWIHYVGFDLLSGLFWTGVNHGCRGLGLQFSQLLFYFVSFLHMLPVFAFTISVFVSSCLCDYPNYFHLIDVLCI